MSEAYYFRRLTIAAITTAGALGLVGCGESALPNDDSVSSAPLSRCYDTPLPSEYQAPAPVPKPTMPDKNGYATTDDWLAAMDSYDTAMQAYMDSLDTWSLPELDVPTLSPDGFVTGDPIYDATIVNKVKAGIVQISTGNTSGTGFVTHDKEGDEVVITAAHVPNNFPIDELTVTANNGTEQKVVNGCYIYEDEGAFVALSEEGQAHPVVEHDIAVLELADPIDATPLEISDTPTARGNWTYFVNYQGDHKPGYPAFYSGQVLSEPTDRQGFQVVTGLERMQTPVTQRELWDNVIQPGASGGPIVDATTGQIVGVSTSGHKDGIYDDAQSLENLYNAQYPGATFNVEKGPWPIVGGAMSTQLVENALDAPVLAN